MPIQNYRYELEKQITKNKTESFCVFIIKVIDNSTDVVVNEIYSTLSLKHGTVLDKYNLFIADVKNNIDSIFDNTFMGNIHKISYYQENIIFKTEIFGVGVNYTLIRLPINEDILNILLDIEVFLNKYFIAGN
jgi:hypothetical protein